MEDQNRSSLNYGHLMFHRDAKNTHCRKDSSFNQIVLGKLDVHMQKNKIRSISFTDTKITFK